MKEFLDVMLQFISTTSGSWLRWFLGGYDGLLLALIVFVVVDYVIGVMRSIISKRWSSKIKLREVFKKILIFILVGIGNILDVQIIGNGSALRTAVIIFYISNVGMSLLNNATYIGLPIPKTLRNILEQLRATEQN